MPTDVPTVDLTRAPLFRLNRAIIKAFHSLFPSVPLLRDFIPERAVGFLFPFPKGRCIVSTQWRAGIVIEPLKGGIVEKQLYRWGSYETGMQRLIQKLLKKGDSVIDAGANVGAMTVVAARCVGSEGKVYSFEPVATTAELLRQTIEFNRFSQVALYEMALSDHAGTAAMFGGGGQANRGGNSLYAEGHTDTVQTDVRLERLDSMLTAEQWQSVKLMKIDVEKSELEVLSGAEKLFLTGHIPAMIVEYTPEANDKAHRLYEFLHALPGCTLYKMSYSKRAEGPLIEVKAENELRAFDNLVLLPNAMKSLVPIRK